MILVCGEALIDMVPRERGDEVGYLARPGGSPYNVAVGLGRLGVPVGFLGRLSSDFLGRMLRDHLAANAVDLTWVREGDELSTLAIVNVPPDGEPEYVFYGQGAADALLSLEELPASFPDEVAALHFGSISLLREPGASTFEACMRREQGRRVLSLDPNVRPGLIRDRGAYLRRLEGWVSLVDVVKVSRADLAWLYPGTPVSESAEHWRSLGPTFVAVTRGRDGAFGFAPGGTAVTPGLSVAVADTVGAGDAFTTGLLAWLHDHDRLGREALAALTPDDVAACLAFANRVAALACTRVGAEPPRRHELGGATAGGAG